MEVTSSAQEAHLTVVGETEGMRLDVFLLERLGTDRTRGDIQRAIRGGFVTLSNKRVVKPSTIVRKGQTITVKHAAWEQAKKRVTPPTDASPLPILRILHEDPSLLVLDKPAGTPVHEGVRKEPTLADALLERYPGLRDVGEDATRPGIVHRLDKETSGVLLVARTQEMYEHLKREFEHRRVQKEYLALVHGVVTESHGSIKLPITRSKRNPLRRTIARRGEGKDAETAFRVLERFREHTLLVVTPRTGRMHQIRVHLTHLGFPIAGDPLYGRKSRYRTPPGLGRQFLHAHTITVHLPSGKLRTFTSPLAEDLADALLKLRGTAPYIPPQK